MYGTSVCYITYTNSRVFVFNHVFLISTEVKQKLITFVSKLLSHENPEVYNSIQRTITSIFKTFNTEIDIEIHIVHTYHIPLTIETLYRTI